MILSGIGVSFNKIYDFLEEEDYLYAIRIPSNDVDEVTDELIEMLTAA